MTRTRIALSTLVLSLATVALVASASARELGGELRRDSAEAAFGREGEQAPPPVTPISTANSAGNGPLDRLYFRSIGPATPSGRVDDLAVLESDPTTFYVAMATSGVYKTTNGGLTWTRVLHVDDDTGATELVMDPSNNKTSLVHQESQRLGIGHAAEEGCVGARRNLRRPGTAGSTKGA